MAEETNRRRVDQRLERIRDEYGTVAVEDKRKVVPAGEFSGVVETGQDGYVGGAYAWVVRDPDDASGVSETFRPGPGDSRRVLFHLPRGSNRWGLPGGGQEGDETLAEAAVREVREETGVECSVTGLWHLRRLEWVPDDESDDRRSYSLQAFFDARDEGGHISIQPGESNGAAWFAELPPEDRMLPANRLRAESWDP